MDRSRCRGFFEVSGVVIAVVVLTPAITGWPLGVGFAREIDAEAALPVAAMTRSVSRWWVVVVS